MSDIYPYQRLLIKSGWELNQSLLNVNSWIVKNFQSYPFFESYNTKILFSFTHKYWIHLLQNNHFFPLCYNKPKGDSTTSLKLVITQICSNLILLSVNVCNSNFVPCFFLAEVRIFQLFNIMINKHSDSISEWFML